jgi:hypothetical protein
MDRPRCPGQDQRSWRPEDIVFVRCPGCGQELELWKDEPMLPCRGCGQEVRNPSLDLGCAEWCAAADRCLGIERG